MTDEKSTGKTTGGCCEGPGAAFPEEMSRMMKQFRGEDGSFDCSQMMAKFRGEDGSIDCGQMMAAMRGMLDAKEEKLESE